MNKKQFLLCKKLFGRINHDQLLNEYVLHKFFAFYQTIQKTEKKKKCISLYLVTRFAYKNKDVWRFLAANMESLADSVKGNIDHKHLENFQEFLRGYTDIFTNNVYATKDYTYHNLRGMIKNKDIVVVKGDKDSSVVIMKKSDYVTK